MDLCDAEYFSLTGAGWIREIDATRLTVEAVAVNVVAYAAREGPERGGTHRKQTDLATPTKLQRSPVRPCRALTRRPNVART
jgi:hypothetical protein